MTEEQFIENLTAAGYSCHKDGVVIIDLAPGEDPDDLRRFVKESGWQRSWGMATRQS